MRTPTFEKKISDPYFFLSSCLAVFVGNSHSVTPMSTLANNKRSCSKKLKNFRPKLRVSCFSGEKFGTVLSRRSQLWRTSRAPSRLIRPRSIDCDSGPKQTTVSRLRLSRLLANSFFEHRQNKLFQKEKVRHLVLSTPHKKPIAGFSFFD